MVREILEDKREIKDQLGSLPEKDIIGMWNYNETLGLEEGPTVYKIQNIAGDTLIWGHDSYGIWGTSKWGSTAQSSFVLGNPSAAILGTSKLGSQISEYVVTKVTNPSNEFREHFRDSTFEDTTFTTADWDTDNYYIDFTAGQVAQTSSIFLNKSNLISAKPKLTIDSGSVDIFMTPNGDDDTPLWYEFTNNVSSNFANLTPSAIQTSIDSAEDSWYKFEATSGTTFTDSGADSNDTTPQQDISGITTTGVDGNAVSFNGVSGDREDVKRYILNDDLATTNVLNDATGADATCNKNTELMSALVGWWKMEEDAANTTVVDSSPFGNDGTLSVNTDTLSTTGKVNNAFDFPEADEKVLIPHDSSLSPTDISFGCWVKLATGAKAKNNRMGVFSKDYREWELFLERIGGESAEVMKFYKSNGSGGYEEKTYTFSFQEDTWYHLFLTFDASTKEAKWYINGSNVSTQTMSYSELSNVSNYDVEIGKRSSGAESFEGIIDEAQVFNRSLSDDELEEIYNSGSGTHLNITEKSPMGSKMFYFDGDSDIVTLGSIGTPTTYFSAEAWIKIDELTGDTQNIAVKGNEDWPDSNGVDVQFAIDGTGHLVMDWNDGSWHTMTSTGTITPGEDTHVALTYDSYRGTNNAKFYINGTLDSGITDDVAEGTSLPNNTSTWYIGAFYDATPGSIVGKFKGYIGNVKISTGRVFGPNEIKLSYNEGNGTEELQDYLTADSDTVMDLTSGCSASFWMKTTNDYYTNLFAREKSASSAFLAFNGSTNRFNYETDTNLFGGTSDALTTDIDDGTWHHYVHTWVINGADVDWKIYVDGTLESSASHTKPTPNDTLTFRYTGLNGSQMRYIYGQAFKGELDDVRFYKDKLLDSTDALVLSGNGTYVPGDDLRLRLVEDEDSTARVSEMKVEYTHE